MVKIKTRRLVKHIIQGVKAPDRYKQSNCILDETPYIENLSCSPKLNFALSYTHYSIWEGPLSINGQEITENSGRNVVPTNDTRNLH